MWKVQQRAGDHLEKQRGQRPQHGLQGQGARVRQDVERQAIPLVHETSRERLVDAEVLPIHIVEVDLDELLHVRPRGQLADQRLVALAHVVALLGRDLGGHAGEGRARGVLDLAQEPQRRARAR